MASDLYDVATKGLMDADIDLLVDVIKVRAVADEDYTFSAAHTSMTPVVKYTGTTDATLASPDTTGGVFDAADLAPAYSALSIDGAKDIDALIIFKFVTDDAGSTPIAYIDLATALTPNGGDVNITWDSGANKIFKIS